MARTDTTQIIAAQRLSPRAHKVLRRLARNSQRVQRPRVTFRQALADVFGEFTAPFKVGIEKMRRVIA